MNKDDFNNTTDSKSQEELSTLLKKLSDLIDSSISNEDASDFVNNQIKKGSSQTDNNSDNTVEAVQEAEPVIETEPVIEPEPVQESKPVEEVNPVQDAKPQQEAEPAQKTEPMQKPKPVEEVNPRQDTKPAQKTVETSEQVKDVIPPVEQHTRIENITSANHTSPVDTSLVTPKIFNELLACFDNKDATIDSRTKKFYGSTSDIVNHKNVSNNNVLKNDTPLPVTDQNKVDIENIVKSASIDQNENKKDEDVFTPIDYSAEKAENNEDEDLFSQIFSEERAEKKERERDKKKWQRTSGGSSLLNLIFDWADIIVLSSVFAMLLFTFVMRLAIVDGGSMKDTLHDKELLVISNLMYSPENNDIIVFSSPNFKGPIVKRVIATSGQTVDIDFDTWTVTVDGKKLEEDYVNRMIGPMSHFDVKFPLTVPEGYLFVMGDNRNESLDSRSTRIGLVDERCILGEVKLRIFPFDKFGSVD